MPLLPLDSWRSIMGFHPWHFWQLSESVLTPLTDACNDLLRQYAWQDADAAGREDVLEAIETAESRLRETLNYWPAPKFIEETVSWQRFYQSTLDNYSRAGVDGRWQGLPLSSGYIQAIGIEDLNVISAAAAVAYSDVDGDGLDETFTISTATAVTDVKKIAVYFATADRFDGSGVSERWRVSPVQVAISGGTVTVKGKRWQVARPVLYEGVASGGTSGALDPLDDANFVTTLSIYERTTDPTGTTTATAQAKFIWETNPYPWWGTCCSSAGNDSGDPAALAEGVGRVVIRNSRLGLVGLGAAAYDATSATWGAVNWSACAPPDRVTVRYYAGYPLDSSGQMEQSLRTIVARLAAAELPKPRCTDSNGNRNLYHWQFDLARAKGQLEEQYQISQQDLDNPWGTRRGHIYAWRQVQNLMTRRGISA